MLLPLMGLALALIIVGALTSLVAAVGDPRHARLAPFVGFSSLLAGLGALSLSLALGFFGEVLDHAAGLRMLAGLGFFVGYAVGGLGGAVSGLILASRRTRGMNS